MASHHKWLVKWNCDYAIVLDPIYSHQDVDRHTEMIKIRIVSVFSIILWFLLKFALYLKKIAYIICIEIQIVSWDMYRDAYRIVAISYRHPIIIITPICRTVSQQERSIFNTDYICLQLVSIPIVCVVNCTCTVKPVCNDHLYDKICYMWFIQ